MRIIEYSLELVPTIYVETNETDWPEWKFTGEWWQLMGMSWEAMEPPEELKVQFDELEEMYREEFQ